MAVTRRQRDQKVPRRPNSLRKDTIYQDSPFLRLPGEIRNRIYGYSLTKHDRVIDLWPYAKLDAVKVSNDPSNPELQRRAQRLVEEIKYKEEQYRDEASCFRHQQDLEYVRKQLAIGLLRTCQQVYREAFIFFYGYNLFSFSDDCNHEAVRRFLTTIGTRAKKEIRCLQIAYPYTWAIDDDRFVPQDAKSHPKLRLAKIYTPKSTTPWDSSHEEEINAAFVASILRNDMRDTLQELQFVIPEGNWWKVKMSQPPWAERQQEGGGELRYNHYIDPKFQNTPWLRKTVVVNKGASFRFQFLRQEPLFEDFGLLMHAGSRNFPGVLVSDPDDTASAHANQFEELERWANFSVRNEHGEDEYCWTWMQDQYWPPMGKAPEDDTSFGIQELIDLNEISIAACGGKVALGPTTKQLRILKGFGGCKFSTYKHRCDCCRVHARDCTCQGHFPGDCPAPWSIRIFPWDSEESVGLTLISFHN